MSCSVVVPTRVIATGVCGRAAGGDQRLGDVADRADRGEQDQGRGRRRTGSSRPCRRQVTTRDLAVVLGGQRDAGVRRDRADRRDAGDDLEAEAGLGAGLRLLGTRGVEERVAGHQPDDAQAALGVLDDDLGAGGVGQRLAVLAEAAVDELGAVASPVALGRQAEHGADQRRVLGRLGDDDVGLRSRSTARTVSRPGSPGPLPTNDTQPRVRAVGVAVRVVWARVMRSASSVGHRLLVRCVRQLSLLRRRASRSRGGCRRRRRRRGRRWRTSAPTSVPSGESATALTQSSSSVLALDDLGQGPDRAEQPPSRVASTARSASTAARVAGRRARRQRRAARSSRARHSTASAPCPGAGSICSGSSTSVASSRRPMRASPARASTTASYSPARTLPIRVSTLPRMSDDLQTEAEGVQLGGPARRAGADRAADRQLAEGEPVAGDDGVARVLARRVRRPARCPSAGRVGRSLSEWTATSTPPSSSASRSALTKTPVPPSWRERARRGGRPRW